MRRSTRILMLVAAMLLSLPLAASADPNPQVSTFKWTPNLEPLGSAPHPPPASGQFNSDLAFWGNTAYQGTYRGFQIIDISDPSDPHTITDYDDCRGNQGDLVVWNTILVRAWNSGASPGATCDSQAVTPEWEGLHIFNISNPLNPALIASVQLPCGSHTATGVPDLANNRLLIYNGGSSANCPWMDLVQIPLNNPASAALLSPPNSFAMSGRSCHDNSVILGDAMLAVCSGGNGFTVFSLGGANGGSLTAPKMLYSKSIDGVSVGHTAAFSANGQVLIFGHEPGGGSQAQCQATSPEVNKTLFFFKAVDGTLLGKWIHPRPQTASENCTVHNFNVVPSARRNVLVSGNYQSGISVVDFTNPANAQEIAFADPAPLDPNTIILGGDWSTYWYDGFIYESDITRGFTSWRLTDPAVSSAQMLDHLNPQTMESTIPFMPTDVCKAKAVTIFGTSANDVLRGTSGPDVFLAGAGNDTVIGGKGKDITCGGDGNDILKGGKGNDIMFGEIGRDFGKGGKGKDTFKGGPGKDRGTGNEKGKP